MESDNFFDKFEKAVSFNKLDKGKIPSKIPSKTKKNLLGKNLKKDTLKSNRKIYQFRRMVLFLWKELNA